jgi:DNA-binding NarL/FixJ family response regulator
MTVEGGTRGGQTEGRTLKVLIVVSRNGTLYQSLARTLEEQMHGCSAHVRETSRGAVDLENDVHLILFHESTDYAADDEIEAYRSVNPGVSMAMLVDDTNIITNRCSDMFESQKIQGILPLTLKLEIWLAAVSLLISGGEYYPVLVRRPPADASHEPDNVPAALPEHLVDAQSVGYLSLLTTREHQILELLSEGYQNKLIAHKMSLSEHTVKVHVHNLLSKLHVSNRTQAAATYRRGSVERPSGQPFKYQHSANGQGALARL